MRSTTTPGRRTLPPGRQLGERPALSHLGRSEDAIELVEQAFAVLAADEPDTDIATLADELARLHFFPGDRAWRCERVELALDIAERLRPTEVIVAGTQHEVATAQEPPHEAHALHRGALEVGLENGPRLRGARAYNNLQSLLDVLDRLDEILPLAVEAYEVARRYGDRGWQHRLGGALAEEYALPGRWDDALRLSAETRPAVTSADTAQFWIVPADIYWFRGDDDATRALLNEAASMPEDPTNILYGQVRSAIDARLARIDRDGDASLTEAAAAVAANVEHRQAETTIGDGLRLAAQAVRSASDPSAATRALDRAREAMTVRTTRPLMATYERLAGVVAALGGDPDEAIGHFAASLPPMRSLGWPLWLAELLLDYADALCADGRADEAAPLVAEARELLEQLGAVRLLPVVEALEDRLPQVATA